MFQIGTSSTTSMPSYPGYVEGPMKDYYTSLGKSGMLSGMDGYSGGVAGLNDNIQWGIGKAQDMGHAATRDFSDGILSAGKGYTPTTISGADIAANMNPYLERVGKSRMQEVGRSYADANARAGAQAASGAAFAGSGSGLALQRGQLARGEAVERDNVINGVLSDAWAQGAQIAGQNAAIQNAANQFNSQQNLSANLGANSAYTDYMGRQGSAMDALFGSGNIGRAYDQQMIDLPWNNFSKYGQALQGAPQGTTNTQPVNFDPFAAIGSLLSFGAF